MTDREYLEIIRQIHLLHTRFDNVENRLGQMSDQMLDDWRDLSGMIYENRKMLQGLEGGIAALPVTGDFRG